MTRPHDKSNESVEDRNRMVKETRRVVGTLEVLPSCHCLGECAFDLDLEVPLGSRLGTVETLSKNGKLKMVVDAVVESP